MKLLIENWRKHLKEEDELQTPSARIERLVDDLDAAVDLVEDQTALAALEPIVEELKGLMAEMMDEEGYEYDGEGMYTPDDSY